MAGSIEAAFLELRDRMTAGAAAEPAWAAFVSAVEATVHDHVPSHYRTIIELAREAAARDGGRELIVDHGCGWGRAVLVLRALGFDRAVGVSLKSSQNIEAWNAWLPDTAIGVVRPFRMYSGSRLPIDDDEVALIFSQQVVEHVDDRGLAPFFAEEARVLRPGGAVYHQVPHRLCPYDSHTRTWGIHYLPRRVRERVFTALGTTVPTNLNLRYPWTIRREIERHIGAVRDFTVLRLSGDDSLASYDGNARLRGVISRLSNVRIAGKVLASVLSKFMMREFVSRKVVSGVGANRR